MREQKDNLEEKKGVCEPFFKIGDLVRYFLKEDSRMFEKHEYQYNGRVLGIIREKYFCKYRITNNFSLSLKAQELLAEEVMDYQVLGYMQDRRIK